MYEAGKQLLGVLGCNVLSECCHPECLSINTYIISKISISTELYRLLYCPQDHCKCSFLSTHYSDTNQTSLGNILPYDNYCTETIFSKQIDILAMTETWLSSCDTAACLDDISPPGFSSWQSYRSHTIRSISCF